MSIKIMSAVWEHAPAEGGKLLVLLALADHANESGLCWPSLPSLAKKARLSQRHVRRILRELERDALVATEIGTGPFGASHYRVICYREDNMTPLTSETRGEDICDRGEDARVREGRTPVSPKPSNNHHKNRHTESSGSKAGTSTKTIVRLMRERRNP